MNEAKFIDVVLDVRGEKAGMGAAPVAEIEANLAKKYSDWKIVTSQLLPDPNGVRWLALLIKE
jgi:hypothetical protein